MHFELDKQDLSVLPSEAQGTKGKPDIAIPKRVTYRIRIVRRVHALPIEQESHTVWRLALTLAESIHQLLERSGSLNLEEDLVVGVGDFYVEMFGLVVSLCAAVWGASVGHGEGKMRIGLLDRDELAMSSLWCSDGYEAHSLCLVGVRDCLLALRGKIDWLYWWGNKEDGGSGGTRWVLYLFLW